MALHFTGPVMHTEKQSGPRKWFSNLPISANPDYIVYFNDFLNAVDLDQTNGWAVGKDSSATAAISGDADGGAVVLTSQATTNDDGASIQSKEENFSLTSGKQCWFEAKVQVSDADDMDAFIGLSDAFATNPEAVLTTGDRVGFQLNDGDATLVCKTEKNGTEESTTTSSDLSDATYAVLGFYYDGKNKVEFYVDRSLVATHSTTIPDDEQLAIALMELSGSATGTKSMTCDYVYVCQER